jgi:hypothetical protein
MDDKTRLQIFPHGDAMKKDGRYRFEIKYEWLGLSINNDIKDLQSLFNKFFTGEIDEKAVDLNVIQKIGHLMTWLLCNMTQNVSHAKAVDIVKTYFESIHAYDVGFPRHTKLEDWETALKTQP